MTPEKAYYYAKKNGGSNKLREICCKDPKYASWYTNDIDNVPREDTRIGACKSPEYAYLYALSIDKGYNRKTRTNSSISPHYYLLYLKNILKSKYYEELKLFPRIKRSDNES